jgi:APA family basic amino acid/polyamine antiporter
VPTAGSAYTYAFATLGEVFAWIIGWDLLLEFALGAAVVARGWSGYLAKLLGLRPDLFGESATVNIGAVLIIAVLPVVAVCRHQAVFAVHQRARRREGSGVFADPGRGGLLHQGRHLTPFIPPAQPAESAETFHQAAIQATLGLQPTGASIRGLPLNPPGELAASSSPCRMDARGNPIRHDFGP